MRRKKVPANGNKTVDVGARMNESDPSRLPIATGSVAVRVGSDPTRFRNASPLRHGWSLLKVRFISSMIGSAVDS